jgi:DNA repair exonuclease SbcCD ATPase subunit/predicted phosphodiesterase
MYKIAHIADTHIRNLKYHYEYREAFRDLYKQLKKEQPDYIVHCGDIAHTKTQLSPEYFALAAEFLSNLGNIAPTIVILGNHDGNLKNANREDAVSPIIEALNHPNLHLLKNAGEYSLDDKIVFNVLSVFDEDNWCHPSDDSKINIALYHGAISNCQTDLGYTMEFGEHEVDIFKHFDYAMLGDIHKRQILDNKGKIQYCGSTIQQNFGESVDKGFLMWNITDKDKFTVKHHVIKNPRPFITVNLTKDGKLPKVNVPADCRLRLIATTNIPPIKMKRATDFAKIKWKPHRVSFRIKTNSYHSEESTNLSDTLKKENLRDITVQEKYIKKYLKDMELEEGIMDKVLELNRRYNQTIEANEEVSRNVIWKIKNIEWDNLFNYGEKNYINFERFTGLVGIFGRNYSGKSSIIDSVLYGLYNSTSKDERKNVHIINQNKEKANVMVQLEADNTVYKISRNLNKYTRKLKGKETIEAKVDLDYSKEVGGVYESLNGITRNETDLNIRKQFGTIDDFLLTSMASQTDSLSFIKEGSTKRKEIIAKFLDLDIFDQKFKMAKKDSTDIKAMIKRFEAKNFHSEIEKNEELLEEIKEAIDKKNKECRITTKAIERHTESLKEVDDLISSIPADIIDIELVKEDIETKQNKVRTLLQKDIDLQISIEKSHEFISEYYKSLESLDYSKLTALKEKCEEYKKDQETYSLDLKQQNQTLEHLQNKMKLLDTHEYDPNCEYCTSNKFVKDAHDAEAKSRDVIERIKYLINMIDEYEEKIEFINTSQVEQKIKQYNSFNDKIIKLQSDIEKNEMESSSNKDKLNLLKNEIDTLKTKEDQYEQNREAIENLETLGREKKALETKLSQLRISYTKCNSEMQECLIEQGSTTQILKNLQREVDEYKEYEKKWVAYEMLMRCMHPNGISYNIIKDKLPLINEEIAKILSNIVDFEVFFDNTDNKLNIYIKHPMYDPRPLTLASGAEKTLASMAIRLGLIAITNLPKSTMFILDEPATALDAEHMAGFISLLDMIKDQFKTVLLISHLDSLKDVVDMTIDIDKIDGYAKVHLK